MAPVTLMPSRLLGSGRQGDDILPPKAGNEPLDHEVERVAAPLGRDLAPPLQLGLEAICFALAARDFLERFCVSQYSRRPPVDADVAGTGIVVVVFRQVTSGPAHVGEAVPVGGDVVHEAIERCPLHRRRRALLPRDEGDVVAFARQHGLEEVPRGNRKNPEANGEAPGGVDGGVAAVDTS